MSTDKLKKVEDAFSERLKMLRKERGWSQEDLAARLDVSPGSVGNWEIGPYEPHAKTLKKIAALFEVEVFYLLHGRHGEASGSMQEKPLTYSGEDLAGILREVEDVRDRLDRLAQQLRKASIKPGAAAGLTEMAATSYDQRRGAKGHAREASDADARRIVSKAEGHSPKSS
jgi:putative transcriptional regulator